MVLGHYGLALCAKRWAPRTSLGWLVFAAQAADLLWPVLLLAGVESVEITKFLSFAQNVIATVNDVAATGNSIETWRIDSHIR